MTRTFSVAAAAAFLAVNIAAVEVMARGQAPAPPAAPAAAQGRGGRGGGGRAGQAFPAQQREAADPAVVARGKGLFSVNCANCHGTDLRGGEEGGPNLLRSEVVLDDQDGELIVPLIENGRANTKMEAIPMPESDAMAIATYIHAISSTAGGQGNPPPGPRAVLNLLVGDATAGQAYFASKCSTCHSPTGDLQGIGSRVPDVMALQDLWVAGSAGRGGRGRGRGAGAAAGAADATAVTVTVTPPGGQPVDGQLGRIDDFLVTLTLANGSERSFARHGDVPKVVIHDPLAPHKALLPTYTDKDIHDVTAYLVTLK